MTERTDFLYIRNYYGVPAEVGRRVEVAGKPGVIAEDRGAYIGVLFDEDHPGTVYPCHPTWRVEYQGIGAVRQLPARKARAKARYRRYREFGDGFDSFRDFLTWDTDPDRSWIGGRIMTAERTDRELLEANHRRCTRIVNTWPKWMQDVTLTKYSVRPAPERYAAAAMAEGGTQCC